jgi:hypothetical protein
MSARWVIASAVAVLSSTLQVGARSGSTDPFAILTPEMPIDGHDREALDEGKVPRQDSPHAGS